MSTHERERLSAYLDGELPPAERALVDAHLRACAECAAFLAEIAAVDAAAAALPAEPPDGSFDGFAARVVRRIEAGSPRARAQRLPAWTWAVAAALVLAVVTPLTLRPPRPAVTPTPMVATPEPEPAHESAATAPAPPAPEPARKAALPRPSSPPLQALPDAAAPAGQPLAQRDEALAGNAFAREGAAPAPPPAAAAPLEARAKGGRERRSADAAEAVVEPMARSAEQESLVVAGIAGDPERAFRRLDAVRPRTGDEWRRLRDDWTAFVLAHPDSPRADEARVRSVEAGWEAWLASGAPEDEAAFRRDARVYLERADARQAPRVERLVAARP